MYGSIFKSSTFVAAGSLLSVPTSVLKGPLVNYAKKKILTAIGRGIVRGRLTLTDSTETYIFGEKVEDNAYSATVNILHDDFWIRVFSTYDIGFSEAFMAGDFSTPDLKALLNLYVDNVKTLDGLSSLVHKLISTVEVVTLRFLSHRPSKAVENCFGYNASNDLCTAFLSKEMQYSCPIWSLKEGGVRGDLEGLRVPGDLEAAQARKIHHVLQKARLKKGDRLLEIGSGWGGVAIVAAKMGCTVDTITLSVEQKSLAEERIKREGLQSMIRVHLMDYRDMPPEFAKSFDACISIEMLEVVGRQYMSTYLSKIDWALKDDRAAAVLTSTTYPEKTYTEYQFCICPIPSFSHFMLTTFRGNDFVRKYHWPAGVSPSASSFVADIQEVLKGNLSLESVEDFGIHYPRCLREWRRRMDEIWSPDLIASLIQRYPKLSDSSLLEAFRRKWIYMFVYMEVAYSCVWLSCHCWTLVRSGHTAQDCA